MVRLDRSKLMDIMIGLSIMISSITFFKQPFEGYFHYLIFLMYFPYFISRYGFQSMSLKILVVPLLFGIINVMMGNCEMFGFIKIFGGMLLSITFYQYVFIHYEYNYEKLFGIYMKGIIICCYIGIVEIVSFNIGFTPGYSFGFILNKWGPHYGGVFGLRLNSIFAEPSQFALVLLPAVFVSIYSLLLRDFAMISLRNAALVLVCLVLTTSSTGFVGIFAALILIAIHLRKFGNLVIVGFFFVIGYLALYNFVPDFKSRIDASVNLWTKDVYTIEDINTSSFVLFNNTHVAFSNFYDHPLMGTGLGSYPNAYEKYSLTKDEDFMIKEGFDNNAQDGNSLLLRSVAELGIIGLVFWFVFIGKYFLRRNPEKDSVDWIMSSAMVTIMAGFLVRQGNYFINGFPFFCLFYYYIKTRPYEFAEETEEEEESAEASAELPS